MTANKLLAWFSVLSGSAFLLLDILMTIGQPYLLLHPLSLALIAIYGLAGALLLYFGFRTLRRRR